MNYRNVALGGAAAGLLAAWLYTKNKTETGRRYEGTLVDPPSALAYPIGAVVGMLVAPLLAGASPAELDKALFKPAR
jgi:hypothetical protein